MILIRKLLFPFAILYGWITSLRNFLYDIGILKSYQFDVPVIAVGNLSVGGTGKTPQIEYLIRLLSERYRVAVLSRGYKRKSKGFLIAEANASAESLGDEPFQMFLKFPQVQVAVDNDRCNGIKKLMSQILKPEVILLDDAFQHRRVKAGCYLLLTAFDDLFFKDYMLPTGNLRERRKGVQRADIIIVTKCPTDISEIEQNDIKAKIGVDKPIYFSRIAYDDVIQNDNEALPVTEIKKEYKILLAGIAKPKPFFAYLQSGSDVELVFPDHHSYTNVDLKTITNQANGKLIVTTEKDYVRLRDNKWLKQLYFLPIASRFVTGKQEFDKYILNYVGTSTRDS